MGKKKFSTALLGSSAKRAAWEAIGRPVMRGCICILSAMMWFLISGFIFLDFLPQFNLYTVIVANIGVSLYDFYFFFTWVPVMSIFVGGIFWASGLMELIWNRVVDILA